MNRSVVRNTLIFLAVLAVLAFIWNFTRPRESLPAETDSNAIPEVPPFSENAAPGRFASQPADEPDDQTGAPSEGDEFLATDYDPLDQWLNERFEIDYKHMTPQLIFDQIPLNDIYYEGLALPENGPEFHLRSADISRRELLKAIAEFWELDMSLVLDEAGNPTAVKVLAPGFYR